MGLILRREDGRERPDAGRLPRQDHAGGHRNRRRHPGKYRPPNVKALDARAEKEVTFGRARVAFDVDVFNLLNSGTVLGRKYDVEADTFNQITEIMNPRIVCFGLRLQF